MLRFTDESLHSLPLDATYEHVLSHNKLWEALSSEISNLHHRARLQKMIERYNAPTSNSPSWSELSAELVAEGVSKTSLDLIRKVFDVCGKRDHLLARV